MLDSPPPSFWRRRLNAFGYALDGWRYLWRTQPNAWMHAGLTVAVVIVAQLLHISRLEWAVLILTFMAVWVAELINTALEAVVDMTMPHPHPLAKAAKDVAAGAVLVGACGAVLIGLLVLGPPLLAWLRG